GRRHRLCAVAPSPLRAGVEVGVAHGDRARRRRGASGGRVGACRGRQPLRRRRRDGARAALRSQDGVAPRLRRRGAVSAAPKHALLAALVCAVGCSSPDGAAVTLPDGAPGIGFDDLRYSPTLDRVLAPAGRSGRLDLVDPSTLAVTSIAGLSVTADYSK